MINKYFNLAISAREFFDVLFGWGKSDWGCQKQMSGSSWSCSGRVEAHTQVSERGVSGQPPGEV